MARGMDWTRAESVKVRDGHERRKSSRPRRSPPETDTLASPAETRRL